MKILFFYRVCFLLSFLAANSLVIADSALEERRLSIDAAVQIAVQDNPSLLSMQMRYQAMAEIPGQQGSLPDPMITLGAMNFPADTYDRDQEGMTQVQIGFSQAFPFPGKLGLKEEAAEFEAKAAFYSVSEMRLKLTYSVRNKWWQIYYLDRAVETIEVNQSLLRQFIQVAKTKYETGKGLQQDVLLSQLELSKLMDKKIQVESLRNNQVFHLNRLMGRDIQTPVVLSKNISLLTPRLLSQSDLYALAHQFNPLLKQKEQSVSAAQSRLQLAEKGYYPDFKLTAVYGDRTGDNPTPMGGERSDLVSVMLGIKIPLYAGSKQDKAVQQRSYEHQKNRYALQDERNQVMADIASALSDYKRASQQVSLFKSGIVPQAKQTVQSMLSAYQVSEVDFLNLVRSQVTLFNYELQYWKALTEAHQIQAKLKSLVGEENIYE